MHRLYIIILIIICTGCQQRWKSALLSTNSDDSLLVIERYDRIESQYVSTGDFAALQEMSTKYPEQTRTLIEDVIRIGRVNDPEINTKFLMYFQDSTLLQLMRDVQDKYASIDDINEELQSAFVRLQKAIPGICVPKVYAQVGSLDQSIVIGNGSVGICLDKYLGKDYPLYAKYYPDHQREQMVREMIVPDIMTFYVLSQFPMPDLQSADRQLANDVHMSKIVWLVNKVMKRKVHSLPYLDKVNKYMQEHGGVTALQLLTKVSYKSVLDGH